MDDTLTSYDFTFPVLQSSSSIMYVTEGDFDRNGDVAETIKCIT